MNTEPRVPDFIRRQYAFAAHIRDPEGAPRPGDVDERRMAVYRDLFYHNLEGLLAGNFPVIRQVLADSRWHAVVRDFLVHHRCRTPHFPEIAQELIAFLANDRTADADDPPFLTELAHYEWTELAVSIDEGDGAPAGTDPNGDLLSGIPLLSPTARPLAYRFPVHRIGPEFQPRAPGEKPTLLVVYRDRTDHVGFVEINQVTWRLLQLVKENHNRTGLELLNDIADELRIAEPDFLIEAGAAMLADLRTRNILIGTRSRKPGKALNLVDKNEGQESPWSDC